MAERRMFAKTIVLSDAFLDMPPTARCLYMTLSMVADDDGFVNNPKSIIRQTGACEDDMKILVAKKFVLIFASGVLVIKHWRINNYLRGDRYHETKYIEERSSLQIEENGAYTTSLKVGIPVGIPSMGTPSIDKDSIDKDSIDKNSDIAHTPKRFTKPSLEEVAAYIAEKGYQIDPEKWYAHYESNGWRVGRNPMKDWKMSIVSWAKSDKGTAPAQDQRKGSYFVAGMQSVSYDDYQSNAQPEEEEDDEQLPFGIGSKLNQ